MSWERLPRDKAIRIKDSSASYHTPTVLPDSPDVGAAWHNDHVANRAWALIPIGNRTAFLHAAIAYLCIGGFIGVGVVFYGANWDSRLNLICVFAAVAIFGIGALLAIFLALRRARKGERTEALYLHHLFREKSASGWRERVTRIPIVRKSRTWAVRNGGDDTCRSCG